MLVLGLLLILSAALVAVGAVFDAGEEAKVEILGQTLTTTVAGVFVAGAFTMLVFLVGVWALMASMSRSRRKRGERKAAKNRQKESVNTLEEERATLRAENERLAEQLARQQSTGTAPGTGTAAATGATAGAATAGAAPRDGTSRDDGRDNGAVDETGHEHRSGARGLMDRVTGRHDDHPTHADQPAHEDHTARPDHTAHAASSPGADPHQSDRVIDDRTDRTDLTTREPTSASGRHRDPI